MSPDISLAEGEVLRGAASPSNTGKRIYHTDPTCPSARQLKSPHPVAREKLNGSYRLCRYCDPEADDQTDAAGTTDQDCPFCGATVSHLAYHLPCEGGAADA